jgi:hypothetical protein
MITGTKPAPVVSASAHIDADPALLYAIIADYRDGHPHILPKPFEGVVVEEGGIGAGTVYLLSMRVLGRTQTARAVITEPIPGRVLVETMVTGKAIVTTFTVDPDPTGRSAVVTFDTEMPTAPGPLGILERWLTRRFLQPIYYRELAQLAAFAASGRYQALRARTAGVSRPAAPLSRPDPEGHGHEGERSRVGSGPFRAA